MDSTPLSDLLPWKTRDPAKDTFWDLHQRLGECDSAAKYFYISMILCKEMSSFGSLFVASIAWF